MNDDTALLLLKDGNGDGCLGVSHINKSNDTFIFFFEITLEEEAVLVGDGRALINYTKTIQASDFTSINECLSLKVGGVRGDCQDDVLGGHFVLYVKFV